jgi:hypothetical protein
VEGRVSEQVVRVDSTVQDPREADLIVLLADHD